MRSSGSRRRLTTRALFGVAIMAPLAAGIGAGAAMGAERLPRLFDKVEAGRWALRPIGSQPGSVTRNICVRDARSLAMVRGGGSGCRVFTNEDKQQKASFSYSCPGGNQGLTRVRVETAKLMVLEAQGISGGTPFNIRYEARRRGDC